MAIRDSITTMRRFTRVCSLLAAALLGLLVVDGASAHLAVLYEEPGTLAAMAGPQADGGQGLGASTWVRQVATSPPVLPGGRTLARIEGDALRGRGAHGMAHMLGDLIRRTDGRPIVVDDIGEDFRGGEGDDLAAALAMLAWKGKPSARSGIARRVHLYVSATEAMATHRDFAGARLAMRRAGGVWLKTFDGGGPWTDDQWRTIPARMLHAITWSRSTPHRVHVVIGAGDQARAWRLARSPEVCRILLNGPGSYRVGTDGTAFVQEFRRFFGAPGEDRSPTCRTPDPISETLARALQAAVALEETGVALPPGAPEPPLPVGAPAQLTVRLPEDPLGLAAAFGLAPEEMWTLSGATLEVSGAGVVTTAPVAGDGAARLAFTPALPGPITGRIVVSGPRLLEILGPDADLLGALRQIGGDPTLEERVIADPAGWSIRVPVHPPDGSPDTPLAVAVPAA